jgi:membrane associated rhomboid family serine protease
MLHENRPDLPLLIEVARSPKRRWVEELALVLTARGIGVQLAHAQTPEGPRYTLLVEESDGPAAGAELLLYRRENESWPRRLAPHEARPGAWVGSAWYAALLLIFFALEGDPVGAWRSGIADSGAILSGNIGLAFSALFLHADAMHLVGNLFFGALFGFLVAAEIGSGPAWLAILLAGGLGNFLNALLYGVGLGVEHRSLGASTAVFGAVGLLAVLEWARRRGGPDSRWRRFAPLVMAVVMLGLYGAAGERTDVSAHAFGIGAGALVGLGLLPLRARLVGRVAVGMGVAAVALVALVCFSVWS